MHVLHILRFMTVLMWLLFPLVQSVLDKRATELSEEECGIADQRVRYDAERRIAFLEEVAGSKVRISDMLGLGFGFYRLMWLLDDF